MSLSIAVGVDIAKAKFDAAVLRDGKFRTKVFANTPAGFKAFIQWLSDHGAAQCPVCMEATGSYYEALALYLVDLAIPVSVVNPLQIARYGEVTGSRNKTDGQDARLIARFCATQQPERWHAPSPATRELRDLVRRLEALLDLERQEKNRLSTAGSLTRASIEAVLALLDEQIKEIRAAIAQHIDRDPDLRDKAGLMNSIPGVGEATIAVILAELPASVMQSVARADAFTGLAPRIRESGSSVRGRGMLSKQGTPRIRRTLYFPAIVATRYNPVVKAFYERMVANGLNKKQAICAAMRKLLHLIIGVLKSGKPFDPAFHLSNKR